MEKKYYVLADNRRMFMTILKDNALPLNRFIYISSKNQLRGIRGGVYINVITFMYSKEDDFIPVLNEREFKCVSIKDIKEEIKYEDWKQLRYELAVKVIVEDLNELYVPTFEAEKRAVDALQHRNNDAVNVEYRCGQVLVALEKLGYILVKDK